MFSISEYSIYKERGKVMKGYTRHQSHEGRGHVSIFPIWWILMFQECWVWMQSFPRKHNTAVLIVVTLNQIIISYKFTFIPNGKGFSTLINRKNGWSKHFSSILDSLHLIQGCAIIPHYARHHRTGCPLPHPSK